MSLTCSWKQTIACGDAPMILSSPTRFIGDMLRRGCPSEILGDHSTNQLAGILRGKVVSRGLFSDQKPLHDMFLRKAEIIGRRRVMHTTRQEPRNL